jgi:hypothetical protein
MQRVVVNYEPGERGLCENGRKSSAFCQQVVFSIRRRHFNETCFDDGKASRKEKMRGR